MDLKIFRCYFLQNPVTTGFSVFIVLVSTPISNLNTPLSILINQDKHIKIIIINIHNKIQNFNIIIIYFKIKHRVIH